jgi:methanol--5-hydroxybenzimidazolylcobamide Co-methyltransferase
VKFKTLSISDPEDLVFGWAPKPVHTRRGLTFGAGIVYPELNFTLPPIQVSRDNLKSILEQYKNTVNEALNRALDLQANGLVIEFEALMEMTRNPEIGVEIVKIMNGVCEHYFHTHQLKSEIRLTPNDLREFERPPLSRSSPLLDLMLDFFDRGAKAGGDLLSIESTGGKEISDDALMMGDIKASFFAMIILGVRDMKMLWKRIVEIAGQNNRLAGGDTACGFANTAMVLAEKKFIPKIFAALIRVLSVVRTIVAHEEGAVGPDKDCGYEGPFLKAIAGIPISMEGKSAACAHFSPVGNIAAACADLWSNESIQNIKLLAGMAPIVSYEQLEYDTRLMNQAIKDGPESVLLLQKLFCDSDAFRDPQAFILTPRNIIEISSAIIQGESYLENAKNGCLKALELIEEAARSGSLEIVAVEKEWIHRLKDEIGSIPENENAFIEEMLSRIDSTKFKPSEYGIFD